MKKIFLLLSVLLVAVVVAKAQPGNFDPAERIQRQVEQITEACGLTKDQVPKVEAIIKEANEKMMEMFQGGGGPGAGGDMEAMRETMQKNRDEQTKAIKALLNENQAKKYDAYLEEEAERRANRGGFGG